MSIVPSGNSRSGARPTGCLAPNLDGPWIATGDARMKRVANEFSQAVFNLPWLVAQEEGLFAPEGIEVEFLRARQWAADRPPEADPLQVNPFWRHAPFEEQAT